MVAGGGAGESWADFVGPYVAVCPVMAGSLTVGLLVLSRDGEPFDEQETGAVSIVAHMLSGEVASLYYREQTRQIAADLEVERERLLHIQVAIRQMLAEPDMKANLLEVADTLRSLGWRQVTLTLFADDGTPQLLGRSDGSGTVEADSSCALDEDLWAQFKAGALEEFRHGGVYFVPEPEAEGVAWQAGDLVFAPLRVGQGDAIGVICVAEPVDGKRPTWEALRPLDILAGQSAYIIENARLLETVSRSAEKLADQVEELSMMHRADRELSSHLNLDRVMRLTMDWALRRTGADTGLLMLMTDDRTGLIPYTIMGYVDREMFTYSEDNPLPITQGIMGRAARTGKTQFVRDVMADKDYVPFHPDVRMHLVVPLSMRGETLGVIALASVRSQAFDDDAVGFLERLSRRAAVALDNARLYRRTEQMANDMAALYNATRTITSTLDRDKILLHIAEAMVGALECSSAVIFDYNDERQEVQVLAVYRDERAVGAQEKLPGLKHTIPLVTYPAFQTVVEQHHPLVLRAVDPSISRLDRANLVEDRIHGMVLVPLVAQGELMGVAAVIEGRRNRVFTSNDVYKAEALASQASIALRQAMLFDEVRELENLKSEMIRMASHDLRNPLNNIMGYIELVAMTLDGIGITPELEQYLESLRRSAQSMKALLEDLLTLERIESEREADWESFDIAGLIAEVIDEQRSGAELKRQVLRYAWEGGRVPVFGSVTQLRQAIANLVGNAIKYTPEEGHVEVTLEVDGGRVHFSVKDDGYGISPERQARLFERFYRAREPGTDHIGGTGLGLSLVKTVVERHGGRVWFTSVPGEGSTFGFLLPVTG